MSRMRALCGALIFFFASSAYAQAALTVLSVKSALEGAITEFRKLVNENPYNVDAILGLGMALFTTGDEARFKEAARYLQQFVKMAPDTHAKKAWARETLRELAAYVQPEN